MRRWKHIVLLVFAWATGSSAQYYSRFGHNGIQGSPSSSRFGTNGFPGFSAPTFSRFGNNVFQGPLATSFSRFSNNAFQGFSEPTFSRFSINGFPGVTAPTFSRLGNNGLQGQSIPDDEADILHSEVHVDHSDDAEFPEFHYTGPLGPTVWPVLYPSCSGENQSPIVIDDRNSQPALVGAFTFINFDNPPIGINITNNGHTVMVTSPEIAILKGGNLPGDFQFLNLHFHWGSDDSRGSEHILNGFRYPLEAHMVFWNLKYSSADEAMHRTDGIAVLSVLFQMSLFDNPTLEPIIQAVDTVLMRGATKTFDRPIFCLNDILPSDTFNYYRYFGSLTTPQCFESVTWTVFRHARHISERQLEEFRKVLDIDNNDRENNFRPVQPLNNRIVYRNVIH